MWELTPWGPAALLDIPFETERVGDILDFYSLPLSNHLSVHPIAQA